MNLEEAIAIIDRYFYDGEKSIYFYDAWNTIKEHLKKENNK